MAKVIFLDQYAGLGGGQRILIDLARAFREAGDDVGVFVPGDGDAAKALQGDGFSVEDIPLPSMTPGGKALSEKLAYPFQARRVASALVRALASRDVDLLYANGPRTFLPAVLAASRLEVPVACALHLIFRGGLERRLIRWCFSRKCVRSAVFCSRAAAEPFSEFLESGKGFVQHYWVSPDFLERPSLRGPHRRDLGLKEGDFAVGVLGRISPTKGQALFLDALIPLLPGYPDLRLFVAGGADFESPGEEERLRERGRAAESGRIVFTGGMVEAIPFLDAMDVLVVPSQWDEPFGLVAVEGMARGLPVVATGTGGLREIVEDGVTGFHIEKNAESLRKAVKGFLDKRSMASAMGTAGRKRVEAHFHPDRCIGNIMVRVHGHL